MLQVVHQSAVRSCHFTDFSNKVKKAKWNTSRCFTTRINGDQVQHQFMSAQNSEVLPCAWCCQQNCCCSCSNAASFIQVASCQIWFGDWLDTRTVVFASPWFQSVAKGNSVQCLAEDHWGLLYAVTTGSSPLCPSLIFFDLHGPWRSLECFVAVLKLQASIISPGRRWSCLTKDGKRWQKQSFANYSDDAVDATRSLVKARNWK